MINYNPQCQRYERKKIHTSYSALATLVRDMLLRRRLGREIS
jgi:hypothetical protein